MNRGCHKRFWFQQIYTSPSCFMKSKFRPYIESKLPTHPLTLKSFVWGSPHSYVRTRVVGWISHTTATNELLLNNCLVRGVVGWGGGCMTAAATPPTLPYIRFLSSVQSDELTACCLFKNISSLIVKENV